MTDHTPDPLERPADARRLDEPFDPLDTSPYGVFAITGGWRGGLLTFRSNSRFDVTFPDVTEDQARQLWQAARDIGILTQILPDRDATIQPYIRQLYRCYRRAYDKGQKATHKECAKAAGSTVVASRQRLLRAGTSWEQLTKDWDAMHGRPS